LNDENHPPKKMPCHGDGSKGQYEVTNEPKYALFLERADTTWGRLRGLLGKHTLAPTYALWLHPCSGVHTFGMRFSIGVFFVDKHGAIVKTIAQLKPNRVALCWQARSVVETTAFESDQIEEIKFAVLQALMQGWSHSTAGIDRGLVSRRCRH
jgi:uncharacterized membrane protein (UPF0127 family)